MFICPDVLRRPMPSILSIGELLEGRIPVLKDQVLKYD